MVAHVQKFNQDEINNNLCLILIVPFSVYAPENDIALPKVEATAGMEIIQAIEIRVGSRRYEGGSNAV